MSHQNLKKLYINLQKRKKALSWLEETYAFKAMQENLIRFLQEEMRISPEQIGLALRYVQQAPNQLPMGLWQYGLISIWQLEQIFDWLETA